MKTKSLAAAAHACALALILVTGCTLFRGSAPPDRAARLGIVVETAVFTGTQLALAKHPELRPQFTDALAGLDSVTSTNGINVAQLQAALSRLPVKELRGDTGALLITSAITVYEATLAQGTQVNQDSYAAVVAKAVSSGLHRALVQPQPPPLPVGGQPSQPPK